MVIDLRTINEYCQKRSMKMKTFRHLQQIAKPGDHWVSFDLKDGFYAQSIHPDDREAFTINLNGQLLQLCTLPMGWSLSTYVFQKLTDVFVNKLRDPEATATRDKTSKAKKRWIRRRRRQAGARLLLFVDDFAIFAKAFDSAMKLKVTTFALLGRFGTAGTPNEELPHLGTCRKTPRHDDRHEEK